MRTEIESGELPRGSRLPSLPDYAQRYDLAISTVQKAWAVLKAEGLIVTSSMGTFVSE